MIAQQDACLFRPARTMFGNNWTSALASSRMGLSSRWKLFPTKQVGQAFVVSFHSAVIQILDRSADLQARNLARSWCLRSSALMLAGRPMVAPTMCGLNPMKAPAVSFLMQLPPCHRPSGLEGSQSVASFEKSFLSKHSRNSDGMKKPTQLRAVTSLGAT